MCLFSGKDSARFIDAHVKVVVALNRCDAMISQQRNGLYTDKARACVESGYRALATATRCKRKPAFDHLRTAEEWTVLAAEYIDLDAHMTL